MFATKLANHCLQLLKAGWEVRVLAERWELVWQADEDDYRYVKVEDCCVERYVIRGTRICYTKRFHVMFDPADIQDAEEGWWYSDDDVLERCIDCYSNCPNKLLRVEAHSAAVSEPVMVFDAADGERIHNRALAFRDGVQAMRQLVVFQHHHVHMPRMVSPPTLVTLQDECMAHALDSPPLFRTIVYLINEGVFDTEHSSRWSKLFVPVFVVD